MNSARVVTIMVKILVGWLVMVLTTLFLALVLGIVAAFAYAALGKAGMGILPEISSFVEQSAVSVLWSACSITGYWVSVRFVVKSRTAAPASLNNSTNSECKS